MSSSNTAEAGLLASFRGYFMYNHPFSGVSRTWVAAICVLACCGLPGRPVQAATADLPPKVSLIQPAAGQAFTDPAAIDILAQAEDADGYIVSVELVTDVGSLGVIRPDPKSASPINPFHWTWTNPPAGDHKLVAIATDNAGLSTSSETAVVTVKRSSGSSPSPAKLEITAPLDGQTFKSGETVDIQAWAADPNGYIPHVDFYDGVQKIGESQIDFIRAPDPGTVVQHHFAWVNPPDGDHELTAHATDAKGLPVVSTAVHVHVGAESAVVVVGITSIDPEATEPNASGVADPAVFRISRLAGPMNVDVPVYYSVGGTAQNGIDYEKLSGQILLPTGQGSVDLVIKPLADKVLDGDESVIVSLEPVVCPAIYPTPPWCYLIGTANMAKAIIHDAQQTPPPPVSVTLLSPPNGAVFSAGQPVEFAAMAITISAAMPAGVLDIVMDDLVLESAKDLKLSFTRSDLKPGTHVVVARWTDASGKQAVSEPAKILVQEVNAVAFVQRKLPAGYIPSQILTVTLTAQPPAKTSAYALEDQPPKGWIVTAISGDGFFDSATGEVKFGLFTDDKARTFTYNVTAPANATGSFEFTGNSSLNGKLYSIGGDHLLTLSGDTHPADANPTDHAISLGELTAYGAAWKTGASWPTGPVPIPLDYLTRAGQIWRNGEKYVYNPSLGAPPLCWVVPASTPSVRGVTVIGGAATRDVQPLALDGQSLLVQITVSPGATVASYAVQEQLPLGWTASSVGADGIFDAQANSIRWGLFLDSATRVLSYQAVPTATTIGVPLRGWVSFDGSRDAVAGQAGVGPAGPAWGGVQFGRIVRGADGSVRLSIRGPADGTSTIQVSSDLLNWKELNPIFLPDGQLEYQDATGGAQTRRFYRTR
jgi:hypothetical protein